MIDPRTAHLAAQLKRRRQRPLSPPDHPMDPSRHQFVPIVDGDDDA